MKQSNIILYSTPTGHVNIEVVFHSAAGELQKEAAVSKMETAQKEGNRSIIRNLEFYNLVGGKLEHHFTSLTTSRF